MTEARGVCLKCLDGSHEAFLFCKGVVKADGLLEGVTDKVALVVMLEPDMLEKQIICLISFHQLHACHKGFECEWTGSWSDSVSDSIVHESSGSSLACKFPIAL